MGQCGGWAHLSLVTCLEVNVQKRILLSVTQLIISSYSYLVLLKWFIGLIILRLLCIKPQWARIFKNNSLFVDLKIHFYLCKYFIFSLESSLLVEHRFSFFSDPRILRSVRKWLRKSASVRCVYFIYLNMLKCTAFLPSLFYCVSQGGVNLSNFFSPGHYGSSHLSLTHLPGKLKPSSQHPGPRDFGICLGLSQNLLHCVVFVT